MSDQVTFHTATGEEKVLEDARKELAAAEDALKAIGKKGLLERQSTHDKKVAEAQATVDAAKAKLAQLTGSQAPETKAAESAPPAAAAAASVASSSNSSVEAAAERIRKLKAENAPQIEVRAAVEAHALEQANALKAANAPQAEVKAAVLNYIALTEDPLVLTPIEVAKKKVRMLKANEAPQDEVKAAVEAYVALVGAESKTEAPAQETKTAARATETPAATETQAPATTEAPATTQAAPTTVEEAADRVRTLKAAKAPQAEVKAAVEAYVALTEAAPKQAEPKATAVSVQQTPVEVAAEKVRSLKAAKAPQAEVKAAVEAYIALTEGGSKGESKASVVAVQQTPVEAAAEKVRQLKAAKAPQPEVKAAVEAYLALTQPAGAATQASAPTPAAESKSSESKASSDLEVAAERVKSLKASKAPQAEVKAAVEAYIVEEAKDKVQKLKAAKAPQAEVKAAVEAYIALTEPQAASSSSSAAAEPTPAAAESAPAAAQSTPAPESNADEETPTVRMHLGESEQ
jgi:hypothetical protein